MATSTYNATIAERGNGFPSAGDLIADIETSTIYRITRMGRIQIGASGSGAANYVHATVEAAELDFGDVDDDELSDCVLTVDAPGDQDSEDDARGDHDRDVARDRKLGGAS